MGIDLNILTPWQAAYALVLAAVLGACLGSFVNCMAYRMVHGGSALKGRSVCPACGHTLGILDLIPVFSWLFLRGRCRHCKKGVAARYVLVEVCMALLFALIVWQYGISVQTAAYLLLSCILLGLSLVDLETLTIPNGFIGTGCALWLATVWFIEPPVHVFGVGSLFTGAFGTGFVPVLVDGIAGAVALGGGMLACSLLFDVVTKKSSLGGGDIKLFFMIGLYLGLPLSLFNLLLSCLLGLLFSAVWLRRASETPDSSAAAVFNNEDTNDKKIDKSSKPFPFGPSIAAATVVTLLAGQMCLTGYFNLF